MVRTGPGISRSAAQHDCRDVAGDVGVVGTR